MGSSNSTPTRSVTISNDNPIGVIDVSDAVVKRLKSGLPKGESRKEDTKPAQPEAKSPAPERPSHVPSSFPNPIPTPAAVFYAEPSLSSHEFSRQKQQELDKNDQYWKNRLATIEGNYNKINSTLEAEYNSTVESVKTQFEKALPARREAKCVDFKDKVIKCLDAHSKDPLSCSSIVEEFVKCVNDSKK